MTKHYLHVQDPIRQAAVLKFDDAFDSKPKKQPRLLRMASNRLTRNQVETIFKKGKVAVGFELMKVSDVIEVLNHMLKLIYKTKRISTGI